MKHQSNEAHTVDIPIDDGIDDGEWVPDGDNPAHHGAWVRDPCDKPGADPCDKPGADPCDKPGADPCDTPGDGMGAEYRGPERRRHRMYVTRNTEYHFRDGFCVAVRDRRTGDFLRGHLALHGRIEAGIKFFSNGAMAPNVGEPRCGESLYFASHGRDLVTSPLEGVERPPCEMVRAYPQVGRLGPEPGRNGPGPRLGHKK